MKTRRCEECSISIRRRNGNTKYCKGCAREKVNARARKWRKDNPERSVANTRKWQKANSLKYQYMGVSYYWRQNEIINPPSFHLFKKMLKQKYCIVCERRNKGRWHLHHNHITKEWVGFICHRCNVGLGMFDDNYKLLRKAARWLKENH